MNIQWYPGHMTKTKRMMQENIKLVDIVIELLDARLPYSSKNPDIDVLAKDKYRIIIMNKADLADDRVTEEWKKYFEQKGFRVVLTNSTNGKGLSQITDVARDLMKEKIKRQQERGRIFVPIRSMIVGIPNVGKSTLINKYVGKAITKTGDKAGVTRSKQWIKVKKDFELLDTPGILWPKFEDQRVGTILAITGAINDAILDQSELACELIKVLRERNIKSLEERYKITIDEDDENWQVLEKIGKARGFLIKGGEIDLDRTSIILIDEFRGCKLGKISLESPNDINNI